MRPSLLILFTLLSFSWHYAFAQDKRKEAQQHYDKKEYTTAIKVYQELLRSPENQDDAALYYNMGNAYYRNGDLGLSILAYERAYRISPRDRYIKHNLLVAQGQTIDRIENKRPYGEELWIRLCDALPMSVLVVAVYLFFTLFLTGILFFLLGKRRYQRQIGFYSALFSLLLFIVGQIMLLSLHNRFRNPNEAIILEGQVAAKSSPDNESTTLFILHEGTKVNIVEKEASDGWYAIMLPDNKLAWLPSDVLQTIYPLYQN